MFHKPKMELFAKIVNGNQPLTIFAKSSTLDVFQGSEYIFETLLEALITNFEALQINFKEF